MSFAITILRRAQKQLADVAPPHYQRIRIGDYRVIYEIHDDAQTVTVLDIGHRRDIYR